MTGEYFELSTAEIALASYEEPSQSHDHFFTRMAGAQIEMFHD